MFGEDCFAGLDHVAHFGGGLVSLGDIIAGTPCRTCLADLDLEVKLGWARQLDIKVPGGLVGNVEEHRLDTLKAELDLAAMWTFDNFPRHEAHTAVKLAHEIRVVERETGPTANLEAVGLEDDAHGWVWKVGGR